jgi:hypothetical protein
MYYTDTHQASQSIDEDEVRAVKEHVAHALTAEALDEASLLCALERVDALLVKASKQLQVALVLSRSYLDALQSS